MTVRRALALLVAVTALSAPQAADAANATYCVSDPACPAGGVAEPDVSAAIAAADADPAFDTIRIGPGTYSPTPPHLTFFVATNVLIVGAGEGATTLTAPNGPSGQEYILALDDPAGSVSDLELRSLKTDQSGLELNGGTVDRVAVNAASNLGGAISGIVTFGGSSTIRHVSIALGPQEFGSGISDFTHAAAGATIEDSSVTAGIGLSNGNGTVTTIRRVRVRSADGFRPFGGTENASQVIVTPHPENTSFSGASVYSSNTCPCTKGVLNTHNVTIDGGGLASSTGVDVEANDFQAGADLNSTVIRGVSTSLRRNSGPSPMLADVSTSYSSYDAASTDVAPAKGPGTVTQTPGNLPGLPDPRFLDPAGGDYRLAHDSPLIDVGDPAVLLAQTDFNGAPRLRDGDGDGNERRDIGATEYQRLPPVVTLSASPSPAFLFQPVAFAATASDPDGEGIATTGLSLGDGVTAPGTSASHAYATPGARPIAFSATDLSGLGATAAATLAVNPRPGACANLQVGGKAADHLIGFDLSGDSLTGGDGNDRLSGGTGDDCLSGQNGNDKLSGGDGNDKLNGGKGKDKLKGGKGKNSYKGGSGNDSINAVNGKKETVDCGSGKKDSAHVDKKDKVKHCERVKRAKK